MTDFSEFEDFASLEAIQGLDPASVARTSTLGTALDFTPAIPVVGRVVNFFRQILRERWKSRPAVDGSRPMASVRFGWKVDVSALLRRTP